MKRLLSLILAVILILTGATVASAAELTTSAEAIACLKIEEGFSKKPYWDYAQWTVGYGTRCPDDKLEEYKANGIPEAEAEALLREQLSSFENAVRRFAAKTGVELQQHQFDALVMLTYNCGAGWSYSSSGVLYQAVASGAGGSELINAFSRWCNAGGDVKTFLLRRRLCEANMYLNGIYSNKAPDTYGYVIFDANGGSCSPNVQGYDTEETPEIIPTAQYTGYTFEGWYTQKNGGKQVTALDASVKNERLYAHWSSPTTQEITGTKVTVTATNVNVRQGPGTVYARVGAVDQGDELIITQIAAGSGYTWGKFTDGWICLQFTDYKQPDTAEPAQPEADTVIRTGTVRVNDLLRIRKGPGTGYDVVGSLKNGEKVSVLEEKTVGTVAWGRIAQGWISMEFVVTDASQEEPETVALTGTVKVNDVLRIRREPGTAGAVVGYLQNGTKVTVTQQKDIGNTTWGKLSAGWVSMDYIVLDAAETPAQNLTGTVKVDDLLRVRSGPGTTYAITAYLQNGAKVTVTEQKTVGSTQWGKIDKGWISLSYVILDGQDTTPQKQTKTVTADCLRVRSGPGTTYKITALLYAGDKVELLETKTGWGRINAGWIDLAYVK